MKKELAIVTPNAIATKTTIFNTRTGLIPIGTYCYKIGSIYEHISMVYVDETNQAEVSKLWNIEYFQNEASAIYNKYNRSNI